MIELTEDQRRELEGPGPTKVHDPKTDETYVLVRADEYERFQASLYDDSEFNPREAYPLVERLMAEDDASDPHLEEYQKLCKDES